jgi:hypothetical protein
MYQRYHNSGMRSSQGSRKLCKEAEEFDRQVCGTNERVRRGPTHSIRDLRGSRAGSRGGGK